MYSYVSACPCEADVIPSSFVVRCAAGAEHMAREYYKRRLRTRWAITAEDDSSAGWRDQKSIDRGALKWFRSTLRAGRRHRKRRLGTIASETARPGPSALFKRMKAACCRADRLLPILLHKADLAIGRIRCCTVELRLFRLQGFVVDGLYGAWLKWDAVRHVAIPTFPLGRPPSEISRGYNCLK